MSRKNIFIFKTRQKMVTKLGQLTKLGPVSTFQLFKLSKLCYHLLSSFKIKIICLDIHSYPPLIAVWNTLTNQFYQKNWRFCIFSNKQKSDMFLRDPFLHHNTQWIPYGNGRVIARDIKKYYFHFQNLTENGSKVWTIYKAEM